MTVTLPLVQAFPAEPSALSGIRSWIQARAREAWFKPDANEDLSLAVTEACWDLLAHERSTFLLLSWWFHNGLVEIRVRDEGVLEQPPTVLKAGDGAGSLLRFPYVLAFVDEIDVRPGTEENPGTMIRLVKEAHVA